MSSKKLKGPGNLEISRKKITILIVISVFAIWVGISAQVIYEATERDPKFCKECHIMDEAYATWRESAHNGVLCTICHPTTVKGLYKEITTTLSEPGRTEILAKVRIPGKTCQDCHEKENPYFVNYNNSLMMYHCTAKNIQCQWCHVKGVHAWEVRTNCDECHTQRYLIQAMNFTCLKCHNYLGSLTNKTLKKESCHACHSDKIVILSIPSKAHSDTWCGDCHKPHVSEAPKPCASCHVKDQLAGLHTISYHSDCLSCHVPHKVMTPKEVCLSCHKDKQEHNKAFSCILCHRFKSKIRV